MLHAQHCVKSYVQMHEIERSIAYLNRCGRGSAGPAIRPYLVPGIRNVVFCRERTEAYRGYLPGYLSYQTPIDMWVLQAMHTDTRHLCQFCVTFLQIPETSVSSVKKQLYPGYHILYHTR